MPLFYELSIIFLITVVVCTFIKLFKQPLTVGYILTGVIVGPYALNIISHSDVIELFSKLGITALLFIVGLNLSPKVIKDIGLTSTVLGTFQVTVTTIVSYFISIGLGFKPVEAIYIAVALSFSSTIIILKLLSDKGDIHKLYGRLSIGILLVQDLIASIILVGLSSLTNVLEIRAVILSVSLTLGKGFVILFVLFVISYYLLPKLNNFFAQSQELLFVFSLAWGMSIASLYYVLGLSVEIGALVAGVTLAITPYSHEISSRLKPLRDFFIILFFILLGSQMVLNNWKGYLLPVLMFSTFVLFAKPLIVFILLNLLGYTKRTSFLTGLAMAQISEFSLIIISVGLQLDHINSDILSAVAVIGVISIAGSTYLIMFSENIYKFLSKYLIVLEIRKIKRDKYKRERLYNAILFGYHRVGSDFVSVFKKNNINFLVIEHNPEAIAVLKELGFPCEYGDAEDVEFLEELPLATCDLFVSTMPDFSTNLLLVEQIRKFNKNAIVILISDNIEDTNELYSAGATYVVMPHYIGANVAAGMISKYMFDHEKYSNEKERHIKYLAEKAKYRSK